MRNPCTTDENPAVTLVPDISCGHPDDVAEVRTEPQHRLFVRFQDNTAGIVDMSALVASPHAGVFKELADPVRFAEARVELGAVVWPNGIDLAPDAMYSALRKCSYWAPE